MSNVLKHRLSQVKVRQRRIAPSAIVVGKRKVWRAEVCAGDDDRPRQAPLIVLHTLDLKASPAAIPTIEQCSAQRRRVGAITLTV